MRRGVSSHFLTLVAALALSARAAVAAPSPDVPREADEPAPAAADAASTPPRLDKEGLVRVAPPPPPLPPSEREPPPYFHRYRHALAPRVGGGLDTKKMADDGGALYLAGLEYEFPGSEDAVYEVGADVLSSSHGALSATRLFRFSRSRTRPFAKAGVGLELDPTDGLAAFLKYKNFQAIGAAGFDANLRPDLAVRFEIEALLSSQTQQLIAAVGYVFSW